MLIIKSTPVAGDARGGEVTVAGLFRMESFPELERVGSVAGKSKLMGIGGAQRVAFHRCLWRKIREFLRVNASDLTPPILEADGLRS